MSCLLLPELLHGYDHLLRDIKSGDELDRSVAEWTHLEREISRLHHAGNLSRPEANAAAIISGNAEVLLTSVDKLSRESDTQYAELLQGVRSILRTPSSLKRYAGAVRHREAEEFPYSGPRSSLSHSLRDWFLTHLPYPYPTYTEKRNLALQDGIPLSKIDSDLTNWRRRSGWAEIRDIYAKKSKEKMKSLILRVQRGEDTRPDLLERIEGIRRYMDKESDKVGDWVHELASFARPEKRPKLDHASPNSTNTSHAGHRSISSVSSTSSLSDISAFATMDDQPSHAHTHDSPSTRSVSSSSTLSDASIVIPSQGPKRSMSFADGEQVANKAKTSHTPLRAEPTWVGSPTEYASSEPSSFSATLVSLGGACNSVSSFSSSSDSSLPSTEGDDGEQTVHDPAAGSASAVSEALTVTDTLMSSECSSIWSTELELPSLPHMHERSAGSWRIPTLSEFRPDIGRWVQRG